MDFQVAPRAGAWIETNSLLRIESPCLSPPVRGRGLKLNRTQSSVAPTWSPPVRGRGLKRTSGTLRAGRQVAPRAGAWIETMLSVPRIRFLVAPRAGAWIET